MNRCALGGVDGAPLVDRVSDDVDDAAQGLLADGDSDGGASIENLSGFQVNIIEDLKNNFLEKSFDQVK